MRENLKKSGIALASALALSATAAGLAPARAADRPDAIAASGIAKVDGGDMYLADREADVVRIRAKHGEYSVLAGKEGISGYKDGGAESALFGSPCDVAGFDGGYAISDTDNNAIRFYRDGNVTTLAGGTAAGYKDASGKKARFDRPTGLAAGDGCLYVSDTGNHAIRKIDADGNVTTLAGGKRGCADGTLEKARFCEPAGLCFFDGCLYVADSGNHRICKIDADGNVTTVAGSDKGAEGDADGGAAESRLSNPQDVTAYKGVLYIADTGNGAVKKLDGGEVATLAAAFSKSGGTVPAEPAGLMARNDYLYVGDLFTGRLIRLPLGT